MCQVMIVDDETYFREYLRTTIPWKEYDFNVCDEASNGQEAIEKIPISRPDIILADINMPIIDGISFSKQVKEKYPYIGIILITGYNEFEYAKQALKIGVENYISKPFEKQELIDCIVSLKKDLNNKKEKEFYINNLQQQYKESLPIMKNNILCRVVKGEYYSDQSKLILNLKKFQIKLPDLPILISALKADIPSEYNLDSLHNLSETLSTIIHKVLDEDEIIFEDNNNRIVIIHSIFNEAKYNLFLESCREIIYYINKSLNLNATIGVGVLCHSIDKIPICYQKACIALKNKFLLQSNRIIEYYSLKFEDTDARKEIFPFKLKNDIIMYTRLLNSDKVEEVFCDIYRFLIGKPLPIDYIYILYTELLSMCFTYLSEYGYDTKKVFGEDFHPFDELISKQTLIETHSYVVSIYQKLILYLNENKNINATKIISKAKEYIENNYHRNDLDIEDIAASVYFHPSYLRYLFKKETGITIGDYLNQVRMLKAKELLKNCKMKYSEVASLLGYADAAYFSKCFKKYNNISPSEYEKLVDQ